MKSFRHLILFFTLVIAAFAAETKSDASGLWSWTSQGPQGPREIKARLETKDGAVTGAIIFVENELPISEGTCKDGLVNFIVIREIHGEKLRVKYSGKLEGDTLTGTIDRPMPGSDEHQVVEWKAARAK